MPLQPFGPWAPDALSIISDASQEQNVAGEALNVLPATSSYGPWPSPAAASLAVASAVRGVGVPRTATNAVALFAGTATKLYKFAGVASAYTDVTRAAGGNYALATDD